MKERIATNIGEVKRRDDTLDISSFIVDFE
jgi:hypothetical protein